MTNNHIGQKSIAKYYIKASSSFSGVYFIVDRETDIVEATAFSESMAKNIIENYGNNKRGTGFDGIPPTFFLSS